MQEAIDNAKAQDLSNKTPDSIKALQEEIAKAKDLLNAEIKTNEAFNAQIEALNNKINNLVEATLVSLHIGVYRYFDNQTIEDAQETDVLRNTFTENNLPVLKNVDTGATYEFNSINSNKKIISFKNVPNSGNYELTIPMQEGAKIVRLTDNQKVEREGEGVVSDTQVKFTLSDNQSFFDHRRIYYEQKSEDVTTTYQVRYEANGGTFVNVPEDLLSDEGQAAVIAKEKFNNFVQTTDWIYQYVNNRYMHIVKEGYTGSWYVKGTNTIVNNTFTINNLAKEVNFDFGNDNNELVLSMRWKPTTELNNLLQALKDKIAEADDLDTSNKTDETVEALNNAVNAGKDLVNSQPTLSQIQEAIDNIDKAIEGLEENEVEIYKLTIDTSEEGVTIDEDNSTVLYLEDEVKQLPAQYQIKLYKEGYTLTGYEVTEGSVFVNGEEVTILGLYDKVSLTSDATIKPVWKVTEGKITLIIKNESPQVQGEKYVIKAIAEDGTEYPFTSNKFAGNQRTWEALNLPNGKYKVVIEGLDGKYIESVTPFGHPDVQANTTYVLNEDGSITIDAKFLDDKPYNSFARYNVELADIYKVTIDTSEEGVTIDESYKVMEADKAGNIELPYRHRMKLEKEGFTFDGYEVVEGKVLLKGNEVTRLGEFDRNIVIEGNVVLKPVWRATTGRVQLEMLGLDYKELRSIKLVAEDGTEYAFKSNSYTNVSRKYEAEKVPSGNYKVIIEDFDFNKYVLSVATEVKGGRYSTAELSMVGEDVLLDVKFDDNQSATAFVRVGLNVELITSDLGVEVRDLNNRRTKDVTITVADEEGNEFTGEFNEYTQYVLNKLLPGKYTISISGLPEKVRTVINDTVANQIGVATQNDNEYTVELTGKENGRQYLAVKFEEIKDVEHKGYIIGLTNVRKSPNGEIIDQVILGTYLEGIVDPKNPNWVIIEHNGEKAYVYKDLIVSEMTPYKGYVVFDTNVRTYPNGDIVKVTGFKTYIDGYVIGDSRWVLFEENGNRRFIFKELVNPNLVPYEGYISNTSNVRSLDTKEVVGTLDIGDYVDGLYDSTEGYVLFKFNNQVRFVHRSLVHPEYKGKTGTAMKGSNLRLTPNGQILDVLKSDTKVKGVINPENPNWLMFKYNGRIVNIYLPLVK